MRRTNANTVPTMNRSLSLSMTVGLVIGGGRRERGEPDAGGRAEPRGHQLGKRLLGLVQGRADDPVAAARGRRFDPLGAAASQQLLPHPVGPPFRLEDAGG